MKKYKFVFVLLGVIFLAGFIVESDAQTTMEFQVIVHKSNPLTTISKAQLSKLLLKKETKWENGQEVLPVDLKENSKIRKDFSETIHGRPVSAIKAYWQKMIFSGRQIPPPERQNDQDVINFIEEHAGGVGYVSLKAVSNQVKKIKVVD